MVHRIIAFLILLALLAYGSPTRAETKGEEPKAFETQTLVGAGGPLGLAFLPTDGYAPSSKPFTLHLGQRLRSPKHSGLGLELSAVLPCGAGANILFDAVHTNGFRLHLIDPGLFWTAQNNPMSRSQVSVPRLHRRWDVTFGLGADWRVKDKVWLTADWRVFMPDPAMLVGYRRLSRPYVDEAIKGGNAWLGMSFTW